MQTIGARYDDISNANSKATFQAGVVQKLGENTRVRANYASGYRAPDIARTFVVKNHFLKMEKIWSRSYK